MAPPMPLLACLVQALFLFLSILWVVAGSSADAVVLDGGRNATALLSILSFEEGYTRVFGDTNLMLLGDGKTVHIALDERTGAGFASQDLYLYGFFSASVKLPSNYAAGVVVAFYMSNGDVYENTHDELDFEFLGNIRGKEWRIQTNVYGNGSTAIGREERYNVWFDPTEDFHRYSILWTKDRILFSVDSVPIREVTRSHAMGGGFPSKPMSLYATIWDGSGWATSGGRYKINYKYAPYVAEFGNLVLHGCAVDPTDHSSTCDGSNLDLSFDGFVVSPDQRSAMERFRKEHMTYSYCFDRRRYWTPLPECAATAKVLQRVKFDKLGIHRPRGRRRSRASASA